MQKTAQKRSLLNKLREMTDVSGIATEKVFNPEFKDLMDRLRDQTDDPVRAIVSGEQMGNASAPSDGLSLKDLLKSSKSNINRREYMKAVADLGRFHKKMNDVVRILSNFRSETDKIHEKFLFDGMDEESKKHLHDLKSRFAENNSEWMVKEANILDFFTNIATERGRALGGWEKRYPKEIGKLKSAIASLLSSSERMLLVTISVLKDLAKARSVRNPDKYIQDSSKIVRKYNEYDTEFKDFYNTYVKGFLEKQELVAPTKTDKTETPQQLGNQNVEIPELVVAPSTSPVTSNPQVVVTPPIPSTIPTSPESSTSGEAATIPAPPPEHQSSPLPPPSAPRMTPEEMKQLELRHGVTAHQKFYNSLQKLSNESPVILAMYINKYAKSIQSTDLVTAIKLFKIAKSIEV